MSKIIAIDPGNTNSAYVIIDQPRRATNSPPW